MKRSRDVDGTLIFWISKEAAAKKSRGPAKRRKAPTKAPSAKSVPGHIPGPPASNSCQDMAPAIGSTADSIPEPVMDTLQPPTAGSIVGIIPVRARRVRRDCGRKKPPREKPQKQQLVPLSDDPISKLKVVLFEMGSASGRPYERYMGIPDHDFLLVDTSVNTRHKSKEVLSVITIESCDQEESYMDEYGPLGTDDYLKEIERQLSL